MKSRRIVATVVSLVVIAIIAAYTYVVVLSPTPQKDSKTNSLEGQTVTPEVLKKFYDQKVTWADCKDEDKDGKKFQCAKVKVPLDYSHPEGKVIEIAMRSVNPSQAKLGSLFINPGGPGGSGQEFLSTALNLVSPSVQSNFNLIGFDPRGVGESAPVHCLTPAELDKQRAYSTNAEGEAAIKETEKMAREYAQKCKDKNGDNLKYMDTESASRDLDILRAVVGDQKLSYLGYSYGTFLGATYAKNFPSHVGRMVLDGVLALSYNYHQVVDAQAGGFEASLNHWAQWCVTEYRQCPFKTKEAGVKLLKELSDKALKTPFPTADAQRPLTSSLYWEALIGCMYSDNLYESLAQGVGQIIHSDKGTLMLKIADLFADREENGKYKNNSYDAFITINSADYPLIGTPEAWNREAKELAKKYPLMGEQMMYGEYAMKQWPYPSHNKRLPFPQHLKLAPVLLVGNLHDPATPYKMAETMHQQIPGSRLITVDSWNHTAYGMGNSCVKNAVDDYLLAGKLPEKNLQCGK